MKMFINIFTKFFFIFIALLLISCGAGDTRKLTTDEIVLNPKDKSRLSQMKEGGTFLSDLMGNSKDTEGSSAGIVSIKALYGKPL